MSERRPQHNLVLILARNFASHLATAVFLVDEQGTVIYYNEAAERVLGRRFIEGHGMTAEEWATVFAPTGEAGHILPLEQIPLGAAMVHRRQAHGVVTILGGDGVQRRIEVTAFPLFAHTDDYVGSIAIFWQLPEDT